MPTIHLKTYLKYNPKFRTRVTGSVLVPVVPFPSASLNTDYDVASLEFFVLEGGSGYGSNEIRCNKALKGKEGERKILTSGSNNPSGYHFPSHQLNRTTLTVPSSLKYCFFPTPTPCSPIPKN